MARTLDLATPDGRWVAVGACDRVRSDAGSLDEVLGTIGETDLGEVEVMRAPERANRWCRGLAVTWHYLAHRLR